MDVSFQPFIERIGAERGPRARTGRLMLETASRLMQEGIVPSVTEVAEAAGVSRATAYRYFPSQAVLVQAVVEEALGPILDWQSESDDAGERVRDLLASSLPRIEAFEATFRTALQLSLSQGARPAEAATGEEPRFKRGHRMRLLREAIEPAEEALGPEQAERLAKALSLLFGVETLIVMKDIWGADGKETCEVALWAAETLVRAAREEVAAKGASGWSDLSGRTTTKGS